jgi:hypothetical protein
MAVSGCAQVLPESLLIRLIPGCTEMIQQGSKELTETFRKLTAGPRGILAGARKL